MPQTVVPVILAGGKGERFWPVSRRQHPKQFLSLDGSGSSLLQATADRLLPLADGWNSLWVVTASHLAEGVRKQLPQLPDANLLVEPEGRDTAPAVAWATLEIAKRYGDSVTIGFFPADHWIDDEEAYRNTLRAAASLAVERGAIATLGITPTFPATGYGYIEQGDAVGTFDSLSAYKVARFTEKPDESTAEDFIASGRFSWNSGMFIFPASVMLAELDAHAAEMMTPLRQRGADAYATLSKLSIDYAVMEKTDKACVMPVVFGWDDLGDWNAVERLMKSPDKPNVEMGQHLGLDTTDSIIYASDKDEVVVTIGLEDVVVVRDGKATLVVHKSRTQDIKKMVKALGADPKFQTLL
jgi:mannose-1-phosphate guanylyltransferase